MTMAAAMSGMVDLLAGLPSVTRTAELDEPDFAAGQVTAVVAYGSPAVEFDSGRGRAYQANYECQLVAVADTERACHDALAVAVDDLARLWWSEQGSITLGGVAREVRFGDISDFVVVNAEDGRYQMAAPFSASAIISV